MQNSITRKYKDVVEYLYQNRSVKVTELSRVFFLSESTIRRLLREMDTQGLVKRYHGGAVLADDEKYLSLTERLGDLAAEKTAIAKLAASFVKENMTIIMLGGTTVRAMCPFLADGRHITVITNSVFVVNDLAHSKNINFILLGGVLNTREMESRGSLTVQGLERIHADALFIGATGMHPVHGLLTDDIEAVDTYRACFKASNTAYVLADCRKFSITKYVVIAPYQEIPNIVTDGGLSTDMHTHLEQMGVHVHIAPCRHHTAE